jgi:lysophospholipase L1-like esterase
MRQAQPPTGADEFFTPAQDPAGLQPGAATAAGRLNVLLLGDSIAIGYTPVVRALMAGRANVHRPAANCGDTRAGLEHLTTWLGATKWDVIHFNWGLHDLCYRHPESTVYGHRDKVNGTIAVPLEQYERHLEELVTRLKATGAKLIWAATTVVPAGEAGRFVGDDEKYNTAAARVMQRHGIAIDDLHALTKEFPADLFTQPGDVHYTPAGNERLGRQVAEVIRRALPAARTE